MLHLSKITGSSNYKIDLRAEEKKAKYIINTSINSDKTFSFTLSNNGINGDRKIFVNVSENDTSENLSIENSENGMWESEKFNKYTGNIRNDADFKVKFNTDTNYKHSESYINIIVYNAVDDDTISTHKIYIINKNKPFLEIEAINDKNNDCVELIESTQNRDKFDLKINNCAKSFTCSLKVKNIGISDLKFSYPTGNRLDESLTFNFSENYIIKKNEEDYLIFRLDTLYKKNNNISPSGSSTDTKKIYNIKESTGTIFYGDGLKIIIQTSGGVFVNNLSKGGKPVGKDTSDTFDKFIDDINNYLNSLRKMRFLGMPLLSIIIGGIGLLLTFLFLKRFLPKSFSIGGFSFKKKLDQEAKLKLAKNLMNYISQENPSDFIKDNNLKNAIFSVKKGNLRRWLPKIDDKNKKSNEFRVKFVKALKETSEENFFNNFEDEELKESTEFKSLVEKYYKDEIQNLVTPSDEEKKNVEYLDIIFEKNKKFIPEIQEKIDSYRNTILGNSDVQTDIVLKEFDNDFKTNEKNTLRNHEKYEFVKKLKENRNNLKKYEEYFNDTKMLLSISKIGDFNLNKVGKICNYIKFAQAAEKAGGSLGTFDSYERRINDRMKADYQNQISNLEKEKDEKLKTIDNFWIASGLDGKYIDNNENELTERIKYQKQIAEILPAIFQSYKKILNSLINSLDELVRGMNMNFIFYNDFKTIKTDYEKALSLLNDDNKLLKRFECSTGDKQELHKVRIKQFYDKIVEKYLLEQTNLLFTYWSYKNVNYQGVSLIDVFKEGQVDTDLLDELIWTIKIYFKQEFDIEIVSVDLFKTKFNGSNHLNANSTSINYIEHPKFKEVWNKLNVEEMLVCDIRSIGLKPIKETAIAEYIKPSVSYKAS